MKFSSPYTYNFIVCINSMGVKEYFKRHGIEGRNAINALLAYKALSFATWSVSLVVCYRYAPLRSWIKRPMGKAALNRLQQRYPVRYKQCQNYILTKSEQLANSRFIKPIPTAFGMKSKQFVFAMSENLLLTKLTLPIILPLQFWLITKVFRQRVVEEELTIDLIKDYADTSYKAFDEYVIGDPLSDRVTEHFDDSCNDRCN